MSSLSDEQELKTPVYAVVGASGGIGSEVCRRLLKQNAKVIAASRDQEKLSALLDGSGAQCFALDATIPEEIDRLVDQIVALHKRIDGVVNCVGSLLLKPAHLTTDDEWASTLATNLNSAFFVLRSSVRAMRKTGGGSIVLISSAAARVGLSNHEAIGAAKAGIIGLALSAAATYARHQIRVNVIAPGMVRTPLTASLTTNSAVFKASTAMHALGRIGEPCDVAAAIEWLLHPHQSWITGQVLGIDGGLSTIWPQVAH